MNVISACGIVMTLVPQSMLIPIFVYRRAHATPVQMGGHLLGVGDLRTQRSYISFQQADPGLQFTYNLALLIENILYDLKILFSCVVHGYSSGINKTVISVSWVLL